jgi:hypothetical protein
MKLLFSSSNGELVEDIGSRLVREGVACEVRFQPSTAEAPYPSSYRELWVQADNDLQWATALVALHSHVGRN